MLSLWNSDVSVIIVTANRFSVFQMSCHEIPDLKQKYFPFSLYFSIFFIILCVIMGFTYLYRVIKLVFLYLYFSSSDSCLCLPWLRLVWLRHPTARHMCSCTRAHTHTHTHTYTHITSHNEHTGISPHLPELRSPSPDVSLQSKYLWPSKSRSRVLSLSASIPLTGILELIISLIVLTVGLQCPCP